MCRLNELCSVHAGSLWALQKLVGPLGLYGPAWSKEVTPAWQDSPQSSSGSPPFGAGAHPAGGPLQTSSCSCELKPGFRSFRPGFRSFLTRSSLLQLIISSPPPGLNPSPTVLLPPSQPPAHSQFAFNQPHLHETPIPGLLNNGNRCMLL